MRDQEAQHEPSDEDFLQNCGLDAFGHLNWTVGNEDWTACFDAILSPEKERIAYHVVVDCENGGFVYTIEKGVVRIDDANAIKNLECFPSYWAYICSEYYIDDEMQPKAEETEECAKRWRQHLESLVQQAKSAV